jgi:type III pantothenate kinase
MFLAIDIGNTAATIGYFMDHVLCGSFHIPSRSGSSDEIGMLIKKLLEKELGTQADISRAGLSSVVPDLTETYCAAIKKYLGVEPNLLNHHIRLDFRILYDDPAQLGMDRLANVMAARKIYGYPTLVIDLGTAAKYEVIDKNGDYLGGLIAPGVWTAAEALFEKGARLFQVELKRPDKLIGTTTEQALGSGIYNGFLGQMYYLKDVIGRELKYPSLKVVATGGYSEIFKDIPGLFDVIDLGLTLKGLEIGLNH